MTSALLIIDVQHGLFAPQPRPGRADETLARINAAIGSARAAGAPVIFVQHEDHGNLVHGTPAWELDSALQAEADDERVRKSASDAFLRTALSQVLETRGARHLVVCGYASEFCVDSTVRRAAALGYDVTLVADAHTTHDKPHADADRIRAHHNATLAAIASYGVKIEALPLAQLSFRASAKRP
jgi:nicotinamidase-related amidase